MTLLPFIALLVWTGSPGADRYVVEYGTSSGEYSQSIETSSTSAIVEVPDGPSYYFAVTASNDGGTSGPSTELCTYGQSLQPVPGGLIISAATGRAVLDVSNDLKTWAQFTTLTGLQGPTFYPLVSPGMFFRLEGSQ